MKVTRCAIYTRKSSEEGLDQSFNSLHAQREACEAYVLSQKHEGWLALSSEYDDGGFSGGNMDRPGLKRLLNDIAASKIDTVGVYKVDRLTRSLADFAKIVESFDGKGVSFVSVTQQFNTTTSMGRLTLNVLLSFAQFEREVTGERIRDKVAASKKKGMWMGGIVPLGYDHGDRQLHINEAEAKQIRDIFKHYLRLKSVFDLYDYLKTNGYRSKQRIKADGKRTVAQFFPAARSTICLATRCTSVRPAMAANSIRAVTRRSSIRRPGTRPLNYLRQIGSRDVPHEIWPLAECSWDYSSMQMDGALLQPMPTRRGDATHTICAKQTTGARPCGCRPLSWSSSSPAESVVYFSGRLIWLATSLPWRSKRRNY
jgi:DNA invertase Pin-like site-specific DNA recombinase